MESKSLFLICNLREIILLPIYAAGFVITEVAQIASGISYTVWSSLTLNLRWPCAISRCSGGDAA